MLKIINLNKIYKIDNDEEYHALKDINLEIDDKGFVVILGKSGSGKSTLMNILGGLDRYDSGEMIIKNKSTNKLTSHEWDSYRNTYVGFVFQEFYIIEEYTVGKNIALALELQGHPKSNIKSRVTEILSQVDLEGHEHRKPSEISGGQKQRIAIARALVKDPRIILADEPTGNLDSETGRLVLQTLKKLSNDKLVIMVTHDQGVAKTYADRIIEIKDGEVVNDVLNEAQSENYIIPLEKKTIIKVPEDGKLNEQAILHIVEYIERHSNDVYLFVTDESNEHLSNKPSLNKIVKPKQIKQNNDDESFELKKSSLPFKHAVRLALNSLLTKKIRLGFITLLFTLSLAFVGIAASISLYDVSKSSAKTFSNVGISYLPIQKQQYTCYKEIQKIHCTDIPVNVTDEDMNLLVEKYPHLKFAKSYDEQIEMPIDEHISEQAVRYPYFKSEFNRIILLDQNEEMFQLRLGAYPKDENDILISDFMAHMLVEFGDIEGVDNLEDVINLIIQDDYKIVGIVKTDYNQFDHLVDEMNRELFVQENYDDITSIYYQNIYMKQETYDLNFNNMNFRTSYLPFARSGLLLITGWFEKNAYATIIPTHPSYENYLIGDSQLPKNNDEMLLPKSAFATIYGARKDADVWEEYERIIGIVGDEFELSMRIPIRTVDNGLRVERKYKIVGIYDDDQLPPLREKEEGQWWSYWISTKEEFETLDNIQHNINSRIIVLLDQNESKNLEFIEAFDYLNYIHQNEYSDTLYQVEEETQNIQRIFYLVGIGLALFTTFLIFSFISLSVRNKQKDIGTLRAIGARGFDVSKIFIIEGLIIAIISSVFGSLIMAFGIHQMNELLKIGFDAELVLLYVSWINILIVFALAFIIILIATFIPVKTITQMKPINAIKKVN